MKDSYNVDSQSIAGGSGTQRARWVVMFDKVPSSKDDEFIEGCIHNCTSEGDEKCTHAKRIKGKSAMVELWEFEGTPTNIRTHKEIILSGVSSTNTHAESNFEIDFKEQRVQAFNLNEFTFPPYSYLGKEKKPLLIAVLDTGVDTSIIPHEFLWQHDKQLGKSFIKNKGKIEDDDENRHGTLVSSLILEQFKDFQDYPVQIMNLKTHDGNGKGDLFAIMDAICFAKENGADIINASWGFYQNEEIASSYLKNLITETLLNEKILFITVSGNKTEDIGQFFYPAGFGKGIPDEQKNMLVVTSLNNGMNKVSETQNSSPEWVDFGVPADFTQNFENREYFMFKLPFKKKPTYVDSTMDNSLSVSGTSFAAAIATGRIGTLGVERKRNKRDLFLQVDGEVFGENPSLSEAINGGRFLKRKLSPSTTLVT